MNSDSGVRIQQGYGLVMKRSSPNQGRPRLVLRDTGKYGVGVFAAEDIKKGTTIATLCGEIIGFDECLKRIKAGKEEQTDSLQVGLERDMDLDEFSRIFNHSCQPNAGLRRTSELIAISRIKRGREITYDYSATVGPNIPKQLWTMRCRCRSKNCRKSIGNVLTVPKKQLDKYRKAGALQDWVRVELDEITRNGGQLPNYKRWVIERGKPQIEVVGSSTFQE